MGNLEFFQMIVVASVAFAALLGVIALIDVIRRPAWQWAQAGRSKGAWIVVLLVGIALGSVGGLICALVYYFSAQPALKRARQPIRPPGGSYQPTSV